MITFSTDKLQKVLLSGGTEQLSETYFDTVTLSGGCEQRNLPSGYTEVEYLQSDSTQYIDTGIPGGKNTLTIECKFMYGTFIAYGGVYGNYVSNDHNGIRFILSSTQDTTYVTNNTICASDGNTVLVCAINQIHTVISKHDTVTLDGVATSITNTQTGTENAGNIALFNRSITNPNTSRDIDLKVYNFKVFDSDTLVLNFIPCRRNSDNVLGMYDTVSQTFLTNAGTGEFTAGSDVTPTPTNPMDIVCNNGVIKVSKNLFDSSLFNTDVGTVITYTTYNIPNGTYTFSSPDFQSILGAANVFVFAGRITSGASSSTNGVSSTTPRTITVTDDQYTVAYRTDMAGSSVAQNPKDFSWQLEKGSTATEYTPYGQIYTDGTQEVVTDSLGNTANAERLLAVGNYKDTQEVLSGSVTRNIGIKVLDGTETWNVGTNVHKGISRNNFYTMFNDATVTGKDTIICSMASWAQTAVSDYSAPACRISNTKNFNIVPFEDLTTIPNVASWKQWLADQYAQGTPVIIVYPLETATTESVSGQFLSKSPVTQTAGSISNLPIAITESSHTTPTPQQPLQINCNNGVVKVSKNLFDATSTILNLAGNESSTLQQNNARYGRYLKVQPNTKYTISRTSTGYINLFETAVVPVVGIHTTQYTAMANAESTTITTSATTQYLYIFTGNANAISADANFQVELGDQATTYHPYGIYTEGTTETVESTGKNLFDYEYFYDNYQIYSTSGVGRCPIKLKPNTTYTVSTNKERNSASASMFVVSGNTIDWFPTTPSNGILVNSPRTVTTDSEGYLCFGTYVKTDLEVPESAFINGTVWVQIEQGSTATTYEPYYNGGTATAENLFKVGTYQDVQSILDGVVTRNVGVKVLDGTENWRFVVHSLPLNQCILDIPNVGNGGPTGPGFSTHHNFKYADVIGNAYFARTAPHPFYIIVNRSTNLSSFKQWLAAQYAQGTPVIIVYPLAEPTTEQVTPQPLTGSQATITAGSIDNLPIESSTITKLKNRYIGNEEVKKVYIGDNLIFANSDFYGVKINHSTGAVERIGNMEWHRTLPIQSKMRRVSILVDGTVRELSNSNVNDLSADIMVEIPEHYSQTYLAIEDGVTYDYIKLYPYARIGQKVPKHYHGAFKASLNRSTDQLRSIITVDVNNCDITDGTNLSYVTDAATYRGGNNLSDWDSLTKSLLGMPVTYKNIANFATYGTNRGSKYAMLNWAARNVLLRLFIVEYATLHSLADFNPNLDINGYHQGGLGSGVTTLDGSSWSSFNSYYPLIPCGVTYGLGNNTGTVNYTLRLAVGGITQVSVPSYRGIESPFGDIWEMCNGIYINGANNVNNIYTENNGIYTRNWQYNDLTKYTLKSNTLALREGWITDWVWDSDGDFLPIANTSGASNTEDTLSPLRDYSWGANTGAKRLVVGGSAHNGVRAGLACFSCSSAVGGANAISGSRLLRLS